jgi:hypothetical protein
MIFEDLTETCWTLNDTANIVINHLHIVLELALHAWILRVNFYSGMWIGPNKW